jgi:hypothetical protein
VNGVVFSGSVLDATGAPGANQGRLGYFSDLYFDPRREEWWALSDRGPGGGVLDYATRVQRLDIKLAHGRAAAARRSIRRTTTKNPPFQRSRRSRPT